MHKQRLTYWGVGLSVVLFALRLWAGNVTGSQAVLSDAFNTLLDIFAYTVLVLSVRVHELGADRGHPFGHRRAEPLAGLVIAIFAAVLGATVVRDSLLALTGPRTVAAETYIVVLLALAMGGKGLLAVLYRAEWRRRDSTAMHAAFIDSRNDVAVSAVALTGLLLGGVWDALAGAGLGVWILVSGAQMGWRNLGFLMGASPAEAELQRIRQQAATVPEVLGVHDVRAHYVGDVLHVEVHVELPGAMSLVQAHDVEMAVRQTIEELPLVERAFVHIDPQQPGEPE